MIRPKIVRPLTEPFRCGNGIPVCPELGVDNDPKGRHRHSSGAVAGTR